MTTSASIQISLIESHDVGAGQTWVTVCHVQECSPRGIRVATEEASRMLLESLARDMIPHTKEEQ